MANLPFLIVASDAREKCFSWEDDILNLEPSLADENDYPHLKFSLNDIEKAGKIIAVKNLHPEGTDIPFEVRDAFLIANNWREAHAYPMRSIRGKIRALLRANKQEGLVAARLKRMQSIRDKLNRLTRLKLQTIQDIGGCRAIVKSISDVKNISDILTHHLSNSFHSEKDFIVSPKDDGYRSHHIIFSYQGKRPTAFDGKKIEVQIRTKLQHTWATAVESVGLIIKKELKYSKGDHNWLRLLTLMSAEFAEHEECPTVPNTPNANERREEIRELAHVLNAVNLLEGVSLAVEGTSSAQLQNTQATHLLVKYDYATNYVYLDPYYTALAATESYNRVESELRENEKMVEVVLVEIDKIANLKIAYPNYFGDVSLFKNHLKNIAQGDKAMQLSLPPRPATPKKEPELIIDPKWMYGSRHPQPKLKFKSKDQKKRSP